MLTARYSDLFRNITQNCRPIAIKTKKFSKSDQVLIKAETDRLLKEIRIKKSNLLWRAQPLEVDNGKGKEECVMVAVARLITESDAYRLPRIESIVKEVAKWKRISTVDLKSAYHEIKITLKNVITVHFNLG